MTGLVCALCGERKMQILLPGSSAANALGIPACEGCARDVLGLGQTGEAEGEEVSRGQGYCEREIVRVLEESETKSLTRAQLEERLCGEGGFRSDNLLRAIRSLARRYRVVYDEARFAQTSVVRLFRPVPESERFTDEQILALLED